MLYGYARVSTHKTKTWNYRSMRSKSWGAGHVQRRGSPFGNNAKVQDQQAHHLPIPGFHTLISNFFVIVFMM